MDNNVTIIALILGIFLLETGVIYAYQIKHTPIQSGYTYLSVATGFNLIFAGLMLFVLLYAAIGVISLAIVLIIVVVCVIVLVALGGPMFITQLMKKREADGKIGAIKKTGNFDRE